MVYLLHIQRLFPNGKGMTKLVHGIVECPSLSDVYLLRFTKRDAIKIKALHKQVHGISG